jgi:hypothetical protein
LSVCIGLFSIMVSNRAGGCGLYFYAERFKRNVESARTMIIP